MCTFGTAPSQLTVTSQFTSLANGKPIATMKDFQPMTNIAPFAMCTSLANPQVASATAAALGVLTPMPCVPATTPWTCTKTMVGGAPAIDNSCKCMCAYGGQISVIFPGQTSTVI